MQCSNTIRNDSSLEATHTTGCLHVQSNKLPGDFLQYLDAVGWVLRPVKPTTESENRLQLDSVLTSVNIDHLTTVGRQYVSCGQRQPPLSGDPVNKMAVNYHKGETDPSGSRVWWISLSLRDIFVPPYRQCLTGSS